MQLFERSEFCIFNADIIKLPKNLNSCTDFFVSFFSKKNESREELVYRQIKNKS